MTCDDDQSGDEDEDEREGEKSTGHGKKWSTANKEKQFTMTEMASLCDIRSCLLDYQASKQVPTTPVAVVVEAHETE